LLHGLILGRFRSGDQRHQRYRGRKAGNGEGQARPSNGCDNVLEIIGREMEGKTAVADAMAMAAFKRSAGITEKKRARRQRRGPAAGAILKGSMRHRRYVPSIEGCAIIGNGGRSTEQAMP
jgi:hypothetical protein